MKNTVNTKKILKATIAFSGILLFGCAPVSENGVDYYEEDTQVVYEPVNEEAIDQAALDEEILIDEDGTILLTDDQIPDNQALPEEQTSEGDFVIVSEEEASVAASTPAEPHVVPAKADEKCPTCKKKESSTASANTAAATPTATGVGVVVGGGVVAETKSDKAEPEKQGDNLPVVEKTVENGADIIVLDEDNGFIIVDKTVDGNVVTDIQEADNGEGVARIQKTVDIQEDNWEEDEEARLRAERARLQSELENLTAEKKSLEDEKIRITQIQQTNTEACDEVKDWVAAEGTTLRTLLLDWGDRVGWRVVWNMDRDYTLEAGAIFRGRFVDVAAALLRSFARAVPAPKGVFYKGNKVLVVSTREDENAD